MPDMVATGDGRIPRWDIAPEQPRLNPAEVHVWRATLALSPMRVIALREFLSDDEQARADRFAFDRDRDRYIAARARLRQILASYLNVRPNDIGFIYNPFGKPHLSQPITDVPLHFNVSHSGEWALYAMAWGRRVGIDVELARQGLAYADLAASVFSPDEQDALVGLSDEQQRISFYSIWTRKEAVIKALGLGFSYPLESFSVSAVPNESTTLNLPDRVDGNRVDENQWTLYSLTPANDYTGALAVEGGPARLCLYDTGW